MSIFKRKKTFHFIGIGGAGMSGLAEILLQMGHHVSGSDQQSSPTTDDLAAKGIKIYQGHSAGQVNTADFVIFSSAVHPENPEMQEARRRNLSIIRRAEMLGQLMNRKFGIAIAGTHGKTTTTGLIGHMLIEAGLDPTVLVGGRLKEIQANARLGKSEFLVAEADEYDRSFLTLFPRIAILTSLEADHLDIYRDVDDLKETFIRFANQVSFDGSLLVYNDDPNLKDIQSRLQRTVIRYGLLPGADYQAAEIHYYANKTVFNVKAFGFSLGAFETRLPGAHNVKNALAAIATGHELEIHDDLIKRALASYEGVERRFDVKGIFADTMVVDDYAHHPTEVEATLSGARQGWQRRIIAVFQPHLYSRTRDFYREFAAALSPADVVIVCDVYPAREKKMPGISGALIYEELQRNGHQQCLYVPDKSDVPEMIRPLLRGNDMIITMGAGDIFQIADVLVNQLKGL